MWWNTRACWFSTPVLVCLITVSVPVSSLSQFHLYFCSILISFSVSSLFLLYSHLFLSASRVSVSVSVPSFCGSLISSHGQRLSVGLIIGLVLVSFSLTASHICMWLRTIFFCLSTSASSISVPVPFFCSSLILSHCQSCFSLSAGLIFSSVLVSFNLPHRYLSDSLISVSVLVSSFCASLICLSAIPSSLSQFHFSGAVSFCLPVFQLLTQNLYL